MIFTLIIILIRLLAFIYYWLKPFVSILYPNYLVSISLVYIALKKEHMLPELHYFYSPNLVDKFIMQVDPNTGVAMYESDDIIKYLVDKYGTFPTQTISFVSYCYYIFHVDVLVFVFYVYYGFWSN